MASKDALSSGAEQIVADRSIVFMVVAFSIVYFTKREPAWMMSVGSDGLARIFHELIWTLAAWPHLQGAGREAVVNLPRVSWNAADAAKAARPKGDFFWLKTDKNLPCEKVNYSTQHG